MIEYLFKKRYRFQVYNSPLVENQTVAGAIFCLKINVGLIPEEVTSIDLPALIFREFSIWTLTQSTLYSCYGQLHLRYDQRSGYEWM
jgi:hypothetical protein